MISHLRLSSRPRLLRRVLTFISQYSITEVWSVPYVSWPQISNLRILLKSLVLPGWSRGQRFVVFYNQGLPDAVNSPTSRHLEQRVSQGRRLCALGPRFNWWMDGYFCQEHSPETVSRSFCPRLPTVNHRDIPGTWYPLLTRANV